MPKYEYMTFDHAFEGPEASPNHPSIRGWIDVLLNAYGEDHWDCSWTLYTTANIRGMSSHLRILIIGKREKSEAISHIEETERRLK